IARHARSRAPMELLRSAEIGIGSGVEGDGHGTRAGRNVIVINDAGWRDACERLGKEVPWTTRRGNLLIEGEPLFQKAGKYLRVGEVVLKIYDECRPCQLMDKQVPGLRAA